MADFGVNIRFPSLFCWLFGHQRVKYVSKIVADHGCPDCVPIGSGYRVVLRSFGPPTIAPCPTCREHPGWNPNNLPPPDERDRRRPRYLREGRTPTYQELAENERDPPETHRQRRQRRTGRVQIPLPACPRCFQPNPNFAIPAKPGWLSLLWKWVVGWFAR